ncbi:DNA double-strand break repair protein Mre11 [Halogeometricum sp. CBA1124]|uniref:DNA double-strand break repair protein Mre11 n=1 Tax=Halogeometricum sp. CBA1124 TaxID=2668071 RepID=UPI00142C2FD8|nr:DNA double-strand break repair protein Mre11 [Halogeometricum sp. CBA1124]MUV57712.1 exonuclease SbcCD subunit D [Halogeometricum sp. CBA1124]
MTRVIHTGDTHVGYQQYHSPDRRRDFLDAFEQVVEDAVADDVDAVVHAGDLFHDRRPELRDLMGTIDVLRQLADAEIPFLAVVGNHESTRGGQWLDLFERLGLAERLGDEPRVVGDTAFYGLDHVPKARRDDLTYDFEPHDCDHAALVGHGLFTPFAHADWETETVLGESNVAFDAFLVGDNHAPGTERVDGTWVTYCGSTERASAAEEDARGYNLVTFDGEVDVRRRSLDTRPFAFVSVELAAGEGAERVREQVRQHDVEDAVAIVEITGDGEPVTPASIEEFLAERGALVGRVTDRRTTETETEVNVSFADPDDAVRERVSDLGLSAAALDVDETVRASKTADANVREEVKTRVDSLVEAGDLDAFAPAEDAADDAAESVTAVTDATDGTETTDATDTTEATDDGIADDVTDPTTEADATAAAGETAGTNATDEADVTDESSATAAADGTDETAESDASSETAETTENDENGDGDGQFTMEDF